MVILRATRKVLDRIQIEDSDLGQSDTALGDWYVNRVVVDRRPLLLLVSSASLLAIIVPARGLKSLPDELPEMVRRRLMPFGVAAEVISQEIEAMDVVKVGPTKDRSILGTMVDLAKILPLYLSPDGWHEADLRTVEMRWEGMPCRLRSVSSDYIFPVKVARKLLESKWGSKP